MFRLLFIITFMLTCFMPAISYASKRTPVGHVSTKEEDRMLKGILAMRGSYGHITRKYARRIVVEAIQVTNTDNNRWFPPHQLIGLAINESDLRWWVVTGPRYYRDCGICQNHTPLFERTGGKREKLCKRITQSTKLSFIYAMKELNSIRKECHKRGRFKENTPKFYRYLLNLYNQGPRYFRNKWRYCTLPRRGGESKTNHKKRIWMCLYRNNYWLRSMCFSKGIRLGLAPKITCRKAYSLKWIDRVYNYRRNRRK